MQESSDIWPLVRQGSWSLLTAFGRILCITLLGALLGAVLGAGLRFVGAPLTLGSSLFFAPILGAMLGAFVGAFRCVRYFAGLLEALLLYHPRKSRDLSFMEMTWDLADVEYSLQTVSYDLPEVGSQTAYLLSCYCRHLYQNIPMILQKPVLLICMTLQISVPLETPQKVH